ncbi:MAG: tail fiber domain-containing protein [Bacteroidaceae bacterium]|nr:tail fiber domain-containing protein [Bacteroidaceae bacterium]
MKKAILMAGMMLAGVCAQAQLTVESNGYTTSSNITATGTTGIGYTGVITATTNLLHTGYDAFTCGPKSIFCARTSLGAHPYIAYSGNQPIFYVNSQGYIYSQGDITTSDSICKTNIVKLASPLQKIRTLHGISFSYKNALTMDDSVQTLSLRDSEANNYLPEGITPEITAQMREEMNRKRIGLIAQEVEKVFPEVVRTQYDGTKGILYSDLVGVLIEAINDLQDSLSIQGEQIAALQKQMNAMQAVFYANNGAQPQLEQQSANADLCQAILYQNTPNPFKQETSIAYRLPSGIQNASICIYNLNGQQLKKYNLDASVISNSVTIEASTLTAGMYIYALIIDGQMVTSKRMVLTE